MRLPSPPLANAHLQQVVVPRKMPSALRDDDVLSAWNCECHLTWQSERGRCAHVKELEMGVAQVRRRQRGQWEV